MYHAVAAIDAKQPSPAPMSARLVVIAGPPCSGKSTVADHLARDPDVHYLQVDRILSVLMPTSDRARGDRNVAYRAMVLTAGELLKCGRTVIMDATFTLSEHRRAAEACAAAHRAPLYLIQCRVSPRVAVERFQRRGAHPAIDLSEDRVRRLAEAYPYGHAGLSEATADSASILAAATAYLKNGEPIALDGSWSSSGAKSD